ncbi:hypothetical protein [Paludisphaera mucosa]|uniref:Zinc ribbon domain-containing protein n=1 Tax=Paludisphaera mucosa TaxID=3030827 RepID=A0ABT6FF05_9BACT|nr:hypothetical protein [Paludisphaera mucosa]MDG3006151.1 hypothetical protein [Paludisphaera mucosa]
MTSAHRYTSVRSGGRALARLAPVVQLGVASLGAAYFLTQAQALLSDAQFTWAERRIAGLIALTTVVGFGLAGWVLGTALRVVAGLLDVLADQAEASWRTVDLMEMHVIPALGRVVARFDAEAGREGPTAPPAATEPRRLKTGRADELMKEWAAAKADEDVDRALDLRDELTQHLRGEALQSLDRELASWIKGLVEARLRARDVDWEVARWVARAIDSLGDEPEAAALRTALPAIRRRAGLCRVCGRAVAGGRDVCGRCEPEAEQDAGTPRRTPSGEKDRR